MKRIYKLNGEETPLDQILSYLEQELIYNGDTSKFEELGIDFEDIDEEFEVEQIDKNLYSAKNDEMEMTALVQDIDGFTRCVSVKKYVFVNGTQEKREFYEKALSDYFERKHPLQPEILDYDVTAKEKWNGIFDVATPQECEKAFEKRIELKWEDE